MNIKKKIVARWRKEPVDTGLMSIGQGVRGAQLREGDDVVIHVSPLGRSASTGLVRGWYWYGYTKNTSQTPCATMEEAKAEAMVFYKSLVADRSPR